MPKITGKEIRKIIRKLSITQLEIPQIQKNGTLTCWAGCYRMIDAYHKNAKKFSNYLQLKNPSCNNPNCEIVPCKQCDAAREVSAILEDLKSIGYEKSIHFKHHLTFPEIKERLKHDRPLMAFKDRGPKIGHFIIISGISISHIFRNTVIIINDPDKLKRESIDPNDLCLTNGHWTQTWEIDR